jgi:hypothetical protein
VIIREEKGREVKAELMNSRNDAKALFETSKCSAVSLFDPLFMNNSSAADSPFQ